MVNAANQPHISFITRFSYQTNLYQFPDPNKKSNRVLTLTDRTNQFMLPPPPNSTTTNRQSRPPPPPPPAAAFPLYKHNSWSPDILRDEEWVKRKDKQLHRRKNKSVTDEDIDELKASIELGFGFNESNDRLTNTLPALGLYYAVNKNYNYTIYKSSSVSSSSSSLISDSDLSAQVDSPQAIFDRGDNPQTMKTRLRQWAQVVAVSLHQSSSSPLLYP
ncbi:uncharacterized protein [Rutidosis leptorrhynchoides]|uniref:uncharacterized protein n=1 Tax=Rutidosis leptorrhynchoides TaxID=125765 RepID=UPI003A98F91C